MTNYDIENAYFGADQVEKIYLGNEVVWSATPPEPVYSAMPLTFEITGDGDIVWKAANENTTVKTIEYSKNGGEWTSITSSTVGAVIQVVTGDIVQFRGDNTAYATSNSNTNNFGSSTATFKIYGNIMSLIDSTGYPTADELSEKQTFNSLFASCTGLTDASNLVLPATVLQQNCYARMFRDCTSLVTVLTILPALVLQGSCYSNMFYGCTSLTNAPELPASVLVSSCYSSMFMRCQLIDYVKCLASDLSVTNATTNWLGNTTFPPHATGTFVKHPNATWPTGSGGVPEGWTVIDNA